MQRRGCWRLSGQSRAGRCFGSRRWLSRTSLLQSPSVLPARTAITGKSRGQRVITKNSALAEARMGVQSAIKNMFATLGLHVRYAFQYPMAAEVKVAGRFFSSPADV